MKKYYVLLLSMFTLATFGQESPYKANNYFEQMGTSLPTPNTYRSASGAPGRDYWQQRADYKINVELDDVNQRLIGSETITYFNNSPEPLRYLWVQLDQNRFKDDALGKVTRGSDIDTKRGESMRSLSAIDGKSDKPYGYMITAVLDAAKRPLKYTINGTMMRVDLPAPLDNGKTFTFSIDWNHNIIEVRAQGGRGGYEFFEKDGNYLYEMAQWFPRMCVYDDVNGWQNKQFIGQGEFALVFGNYEVAITAPNDMVVGATGEIQNMDKVLSNEMKKRLKQAETSKIPVLIVNQSEAEAAEKGKPTGKKTWIFKAENVRDFAFAASRKFIWDAMKVDVEGKGVWAMSLYPKEANPLWGQYSTRVIAHTLKSYSARTFQYPYPVAYSVHGPVGGMEYPMMSFNGARPEADGTYAEGTKNFLILVIIHEVGHNYFPMIVNSDERQWSWMDEGLNSFLEGLACLEWDRDFPATGIQPQSIVRYMKTDADKQNPIMSSSDNIVPGTFGPNAYSKPATGLNILRETIMGRELFDYAFKEYSRRWAFKHPQPADFFRTMEDASGVDLDWFWKGWFYGVDAADQAIADVEWYSLDDQNPEVAKAAQKEEDMARKETMSNIRNRTDIKQTVVEADPTMWDFYNSYDPYKATEAEKKKYENYLAGLTDEERKAIQENKNFYVLKLKNKGGLMMPVIVQMTYEDGTTEVVRYPVEIWRTNAEAISKTIATTKKVTKFKLDPFFEIPDIDTSDNAYPREPEQPTKFQLYKNERRSAPNPMQEAKKASGGAATGTN